MECYSSAVSEHYNCNLPNRFLDDKFDTVIVRNDFYEPVASKKFIKSARSLKVYITWWRFESILDLADFAEHVELETPWVLYQTMDTIMIVCCTQRVQRLGNFRQ